MKFRIAYRFAVKNYCSTHKVIIFSKFYAKLFLQISFLNNDLNAKKMFYLINSKVLPQKYYGKT